MQGWYIAEASCALPLHPLLFRQHPPPSPPLMHVHSLVTLLLTYGLYVSAVPLSSLSALMNSVQSHPASKLPAFADTHSPTLSLARRFNSTGSANVLKFDQARARTLQQRTQTNADSDDGTSLGGDALFEQSVTSQVVTYVATVSLLLSCSCSIYAQLRARSKSENLHNRVRSSSAN